MITPPAHVLAAFGVPPGTEVQPLDGGQGSSVRCGNSVLKPVNNHAEASWLAGTLDTVHVPGLRIARPIRASDGRWVVAGWSANRFVAGRPEPRYDELIETSLALHSALAELPRPRFIGEREDLYSWADRLAWGEIADEDGRLGDGHGHGLFEELAAGRRPVASTPQIVHGDLFGNVLFAGSAPPAVIDFTPYWRPPAWAAAVVAVDALCWGGAPGDFVGHWSHLPEWGQMLRRALMFRLAVGLVHPRTTPEALVEVLAGAQLLRDQLD